MWGVFLFGACLVVVAIVIHVLLFGLFRDYEKAEKKRSPELPPVARTLPTFPQDIPAIPEPRLQTNDAADMAALRSREEAALHGGPKWVDPAKGIVQIPIDQAIRRLSADARVAEANGLRTRPDEKGKKP
jgi:hypothetical protein